MDKASLKVVIENPQNIVFDNNSLNRELFNVISRAISSDKQNDDVFSSGIDFSINILSENETRISKTKRKSSYKYHRNLFVDNEELLNLVLEAGYTDKLLGVKKCRGNNVWYFSLDDDIRNIIHNYYKREDMSASEETCSALNE